MENYQTWRDLLSTLIEKPRERARLAKRLGVSTLTLQRWTTHEATPQPQQRQLLLQALPQHAMLLRALLAEEFHDLATQDARLDSSLANFSAHVFDIHANAPDESRYWSICTAILSEAVKQLDSQQIGISLSVIQCMAPPQAGSVRYLRECASLGTSPWSAQIEFRTSFLGAESLAGQAVATMHPQESADCRREPAIARHLPEKCSKRHYLTNPPQRTRCWLSPGHQHATRLFRVPGARGLAPELYGPAQTRFFAGGFLPARTGGTPEHARPPNARPLSVQLPATPARYPEDSVYRRPFPQLSRSPTLCLGTNRGRVAAITDFLNTIKQSFGEWNTNVPNTCLPDQIPSGATIPCH